MTAYYGILKYMLLLKLIEALVLKCIYIDDDVGSDADYVVWTVDNEENDIEIEYEVDYYKNISVGKYVKNEVDVNIIDRVGCDVDRSFSSEVGKGNDIWEWWCCWSSNYWWWMIWIISCEWS